MNENLSSNEINKNVALNLVKYRKSLSLTQADLAKKLNYSNKAISKWERMEAIPDIYVLKKIADLFRITVDELISPPQEKKPFILKLIVQGKVMKTFIHLGIVWLIAVLAYTLIDLVFPTINEIFPLWLIFIYALPISFLILPFIWNKSVCSLIFISLGCWAILLSVFTSLLVLMPNPPSALWQIFLIGAPIQALLIFMYFYRLLFFRKPKPKI